MGRDPGFEMKEKEYGKFFAYDRCGVYQGKRDLGRLPFGICAAREGVALFRLRSGSIKRGD
jgi:hypothetical protein